ncbi:DUF4224 domain-containing protein [Paralcaligenes ginsengisoli]
MSDYLTADELADLIQCKPNQRIMMVRWLEDHRWKFDTGRNGLPRVLKTYRDKKLGLNNDEKKQLDTAPNLDAFVAKNRNPATVQAGRRP